MDLTADIEGAHPERDNNRDQICYSEYIQDRHQMSRKALFEMIRNSYDWITVIRQHLGLDPVPRIKKV